jgi:hypothetical protein
VVASPITIDFKTYSAGTAVTNVNGVTFSLLGGPDSSGAPLIGPANGIPMGLSNSSNSGYPTANILDVAFGTPVSGLSFYFNNFGFNAFYHGSYFEAFDSTHNLLASGDLSTQDGNENNIVLANGIADLQFNNGMASWSSTSSWYFAVPSITFDPVAIPEPAGLAIFGAGVAGLGLLRRHRRRSC